MPPVKQEISSMAAHKAGKRWTFNVQTRQLSESHRCLAAYLSKAPLPWPYAQSTLVHPCCGGTLVPWFVTAQGGDKLRAGGHACRVHAAEPSPVSPGDR